MVAVMPRNGYAEMTDEGLVRSYREHRDELAFRELRRRYEGLIQSRARDYFIRGADRSDAVQEATLGFWKAVRDFNYTGSFRCFADLCTTRTVITAVKTGQRLKQRPLNDAISYDAPETEHDRLRYLSAPGDDNPEDVVLTKERARELERLARTRLSKREFACLSFHVDGKSYREIVNALRNHPDDEVRITEVKQVDNALQRAAKKFRPDMASV